MSASESPLKYDGPPSPFQRTSPKGPCAETDYLLRLSAELGYCNTHALTPLIKDIGTVARMLQALRGKLGARRQRTNSQ
jgi:hypothetical protein